MGVLKVEDVSEVIVGEFYLVPTVCVQTLPKVMQIVPVIGPTHEDAEFIGFPHRHVHPDRRFVSAQLLDYYSRTRSSGHWSIVYSFEVHGRDTGMRDAGLRRMKCKREVESFRKDAPWLPELERAYKDATLRDGHICPHRGISCRGVVAENGGVVCPGHGLKFDLVTGHLISRIGQTFQLGLSKVAAEVRR